MDNVFYDSEPIEVPSWLFIDAVRYCIGRRSYQVGVTTEWLVANWDKLPHHARSVIQLDLEGEFRRDDQARAEGWEYKPLGMDMDRRCWERVRRSYLDAPRVGEVEGEVAFVVRYVRQTEGTALEEIASDREQE